MKIAIEFSQHLELLISSIVVPVPMVDAISILSKRLQSKDFSQSRNTGRKEVFSSLTNHPLNWQFEAIWLINVAIDIHSALHTRSGLTNDSIKARSGNRLAFKEARIVGPSYEVTVSISSCVISGKDIMDGSTYPAARTGSQLQSGSDSI